jgi:hypothetical protein
MSSEIMLVGHSWGNAQEAVSVNCTYPRPISTEFDGTRGGVNPYGGNFMPPKEGDFMLGLMLTGSVNDGATSDHSISGWTTEWDNTQDILSPGSTIRFAVFYKFRTASEPSSYTISHSTINTDRHFWILCFRGVDPNSPFQVAPSATQRNGGAASDTHTFVAATAVLNSIGICMSYQSAVIAGNSSSVPETYAATYTPSVYQNNRSQSKYKIRQDPYWYRSYAGVGTLRPISGWVNFSGPLAAQSYTPIATYPSTASVIGLHFMLKPAPIVVTDINTNETWTDGDTNIPITGTGMHRRGSN